MTKARKNRSKTVRHSRHADTLPGRTPSKAFLAALDAVGRMKGKKKL